MKTPKEFQKSIKNGVVPPEIISDVLYSYNKRAKNMRDKEQEYRIKERCNFFSAGYYYDNEENYRAKKEEYYEKKDKLLNLLTPSCIHLVKRRVYGTINEDSADDNLYEGLVIEDSFDHYDREINDYETLCRVSYLVEDYYLYYEFGEHSFHTPIEDVPKGNTLPIVKIDDLTTYGEFVGNLLSVQFCDKVLNGLTSGKLTLVLN